MAGDGRALHKPVDWTEFDEWELRISLSEPRERVVNPLLGCADLMHRLHAPRWLPHHPKEHHLAASGGFNIWALTQFTSGAVGGGTATYCTHWLDTIKVKMQTFPDLYRSGTHCLKDTLQQEGIKGLYRGVAPAILGSGAKAALVFTLYGLSDEVVRHLTGVETIDDLTTWHHASSGAVTGMLTSIVLCPIELVKCRQQAEKQMATNSHRKAVPKSSVTLVREALRSGGIRGLFPGLVSMWVKDIPGSFVYFGSYELAKSVTKRIEHTSSLGTAEVFGCGVAAGMCYCVMHPVDAVKTRVQVMSAVGHPNMPEAKGFLRPLLYIIRNEGVLPLFSGIKPAMVRGCAYSGIQFVAFETVKHFILDQLDSKDNPDTGDTSS